MILKIKLRPQSETPIAKAGPNVVVMTDSPRQTESTDHRALPARLRSGRLVRIIALALPALIIAALLTVMVSPVNAKPFIPGPVPIDRVIQNVTDFAVKNPNDDFAHYLVGRSHYAALFDLKEVSVKLGEGDEPAIFPGALGPLYPASANTISALDSARLLHVNTAVSELRTAVRFARAAKPRTDLETEREGLYLLTLASISEQVAPFADQLPSPPIVVKKQPKTWINSASEAYLRSYQLTISKDLTVTKQPLFGLATLISYEAGTSYVRLNPKAANIRSIKKALKQLDNKPRGPITPFIFSMTRPVSATSIDQLIDAGVTTSFDLDGTGRAQRYPWVRNDTAMLVWDPAHTGRITSGRQLFGSATWWMLWEDAYQALDSLDNNRDGWLRGAELPGLAIWIDRNQNGISEIGEVTAVEDTSVVGIAARSTGVAGRSPTNPSGIELANGTTVASFDWVVDPLR